MDHKNAINERGKTGYGFDGYCFRIIVYNQKSKLSLRSDEDEFQLLQSRERVKSKLVYCFI